MRGRCKQPANLARPGGRIARQFGRAQTGVRAWAAATFDFASEEAKSSDAKSKDAKSKALHRRGLRADLRGFDDVCVCQSDSLNLKRKRFVEEDALGWICGAEERREDPDLTDL